MSVRSSLAAVFVFLSLLVSACQSGAGAACASCSTCASPDAQAIVDALAKEHPEVTRLTVHGKPAGCDHYCAIASTVAARVCKTSDPEDLQAMSTGKPIVLEEVGAVDVTVPACKAGPQWTMAIGVTFGPSAGQDRGELVKLAGAIARVIEDRLATPKK